VVLVDWLLLVVVVRDNLQLVVVVVQDRGILEVLVVLHYHYLLLVQPVKLDFLFLNFTCTV
jgi:hypothetical protein